MPKFKEKYRDYGFLDTGKQIIQFGGKDKVFTDFSQQKKAPLEGSSLTGILSNRFE